MNTVISKTNKVTFLFAVNSKEQLTQIKQITSTIFGGYNITQNFGGWVSENNELLEEVSYKLEILTDKEYRYFENLTQHICKIANQKEVYFYIDNIKLNITQNY
tara:strand:- start:12145 stop:12456 length:312 start_codon:yes stop_codon:yes gene_type:complete